MSIMRYYVAALLIAVVGAVLIFKPGHSAPAQPAVQPTQPCASNGPACISITQADGTVYKLNDFWFMPKHCISFVALPSRVMHNYCGNYNLKWIGPVPANARG